MKDKTKARPASTTEKMWHETLDKKEETMLLRIAGKLNLPDFSEYQNKERFLFDVYSKICEASFLINLKRNYPSATISPMWLMMLMRADKNI